MILNAVTLVVELVEEIQQRENSSVLNKILVGSIMCCYFILKTNKQTNKQSVHNQVQVK